MINVIRLGWKKCSFCYFFEPNICCNTDPMIREKDLLCPYQNNCRKNAPPWFLVYAHADICGDFKLNRSPTKRIYSENENKVLLGTNQYLKYAVFNYYRENGILAKYYDRSNVDIGCKPILNNIGAQRAYRWRRKIKDKFVYNSNWRFDFKRDIKRKCKQL